MNNILEEINPLFDDIIDDYDLSYAYIQEVSDYLIIDVNKNHNTYFIDIENDTYTFNLFLPISDKDDQKLFDKWYLYHSSKKIVEDMFIIVNEQLYKDINFIKQRVESMGYNISIEYKKSRINTELFQVEMKVFE